MTSLTQRRHKLLMFLIVTVLTTILVITTNYKYGRINQTFAASDVLTSQDSFSGTNEQDRTNNNLGSSSQQCDNDCQEKVQRMRKNHLTKQCEQLGLSKKDEDVKVTSRLLKELNHSIVLEEYKVIYSFIPKAGCTNWKRILLLLKGVVTSVDDLEQHEAHFLVKKNMKLLSSYKVQEARHILKSYTKFVFVRNPFARILSAYKDKIEKPTKLNPKFRVFWNRKINLGLEKNASVVGDNTTFIHYVDYLSNHSVNEDHWQTIITLSRPCEVQYDFIGKMETLDRDINFVLKNIIRNTSERVLFRTSTNPTGSSTMLERYFAGVPRRNKQALYDQFKNDFLLFGYDKPADLN
ncbi:carbohydrate sulfotransferase 11-like isoform X2 [Apostichopus japonicus]|uniref:carbohydrate sulfotransferase 11-like isoform X2 n=1 Tax=Stichopus japonicus TaxID=307972 RepID=UPI003AB1D885